METLSKSGRLLGAGKTVGLYRISINHRRTEAAAQLFFCEFFESLCLLDRVDYSAIPSSCLMERVLYFVKLYKLIFTLRKDFKQSSDFQK